METEHQPSVRYETKDIDARTVFFIGLGVLLSTMVIVGFMHLLFSYWRGVKDHQSQPASPLARNLTQYPPEPRLQASPHLDYETMRAEANWKLHHYQWLDQPKGVVALPIDRAMDLIVQRGIPPSSLPASQFYKPEEGDRLTGFGERQEPEP